MKRAFLTSAALAAAVSLGGFIPAAQASIIGASPNANLSGSPFTINIQDQASFTFYANGNLYNGIDVTTGGSGLVTSIGQPFNPEPQPTSFKRGAPIGDYKLAGFAGYSSPATIPFTFGGTFLGLKFTLSDGIHFGYVKVGTFKTPTLFQYAYNSVVGESIATGAPITQPLPTTAVPAPPMVLLFALGLSLLGVGMVRRRT